ncbi:MAG: hypothetical protein M1823_001542 [Watsoniomyces obsoletus]|nr:MAG: hypothetical protein M1823_001542 [Watsoniomyces obsoletus]
MAPVSQAGRRPLDPMTADRVWLDVKMHRHRTDMRHNSSLATRTVATRATSSRHGNFSSASHHSLASDPNGSHWFSGLPRGALPVVLSAAIADLVLIRLVQHQERHMLRMPTLQDDDITAIP